jgi:hypothetical protein
MNKIVDVRKMSAQDLSALGLQDMAYVRATRFEGAEGYGIFAADGTQVAFAPDRALADQAVREHNLEPVSVH